MASINLSRRSFVASAASALGAVAFLGITGCSSGGSGSGSGGNANGGTTTQAGTTDSSGITTLKAQADLTPHQEILDHAKDALADKGVAVDIVTNDGQNANQMVESGEIDFNYDQHEPYLKSWNSQNGGDIVNAGNIHVEPITAYSDKYQSTDEVPDNAVVAIPSDPTNEYRALSILQTAGFITLDDQASTDLGASTKNISAYNRPLKIVELDSEQIIPTKDDYDFFITNTNKALEANLKSNKLFSEGKDSPYANIIAVKSGHENDPAIKSLVEVLQSDEVQDWINDHYQGAVIGAVKN